MNLVYRNIQVASNNGEKLLAILIDPDKFFIKNTYNFIKKVNASIATHVFVGGSVVAKNITDILVEEIKKYTKLPIVLFPGAITQITNKADAILFLSLLSGRNPDYLIGKHVKAVSKLEKTNLEVISTGYILIESGKKTAVELVTATKPMSRSNVKKIINTAKAGALLGMKLIYLEAGSGAKEMLSETIIKNVKKELDIPLIVGGGIINKEQLELAYRAGANLVVIGTAFEDDELFFNEIKR